MMMDETPVVMMNLPTGIRGFVCLGEDGEPLIVVNARLTREQNAVTYEHERRHIQRGEIFEPSYNEYGRDIDGTV